MFNLDIIEVKRKDKNREEEIWKEGRIDGIEWNDMRWWKEKRICRGMEGGREINSPMVAYAKMVLFHVHKILELHENHASQLFSMNKWYYTYLFLNRN